MNRNFVPIERSVVDGTLREMYPAITPLHWSFWLYAHSCISGTSGELYPGHDAAETYCGLTFDAPETTVLSASKKTMLLYRPFLDVRLAALAGKGVKQGREFQKFMVLTSTLTSVPGKPFTGALRKSAHIPFVMLPGALFKGPWATLPDAERFWLCAVYAFLMLGNGKVNPNHLRIEVGRVVTSQAFDKASGATGPGSTDLLVSLMAKGLVSTVDTPLRIAHEYPGSRSPLSLATAPVSLRDTRIHAHLVVPTLALDPDSARKAAAR